MKLKEDKLKSMHNIAPIFLTNWFRHHSHVSGYDQLALHWKNPKLLLKLRHNTDKKHWSNRIMKFGYQIIARELNRRLLSHHIQAEAEHGQVLHVLYGEMYLPLPLRQKKYLSIVATIHQPPSYLARSEKRLKQLHHQLQYVDYVIALSREQESFFKKICNWSQVRFVPHGVDTTFFTPKEVQRQRSILIVGNWLRDWDNAALILKQVLQKDPKIEIILVNPAPTHPLRYALPSENLHCTDRLTDLQLLESYRRCGVVFFSFNGAVANNALLEASACGCRIVATDIGGVRDYVGETAYLFPSNSTPDFVANQLLQAIDESQTEAIDVVAVTNTEKFDWGIITSQMNEVYVEALNNSPKGKL